MTYNDVTRNEKAISGALALATHLLFLALLVFGVSWQQKQPDSAVIVDLWSNLPPLPQPKVAEPPPEVKPPPEPPKPVPEAAPKPAPKVEPKPAPKPEVKPPPKPDIALKEKLVEKERKLKEQQTLDAKKREDEKKKKAELKAQKEKEAEAQRLAWEHEEAQRKLAQQLAAAHTRLLDEYKQRIREKIRRFIVEPPNLQGNPQAEFDVVQIPGGEVLSVKLRRTSGVAAYDSAVERAILKAQPLPPPPKPEMFVRELHLTFKPKD